MGLTGGQSLVSVGPLGALVSVGPPGALVQQFGVDVAVVDVANIVVVHQLHCYGNLDLVRAIRTFDTILLSC